MKKPIVLLEEENGIKKISIPGEFSSHLSTFAYLYLQPNGWFNDYPCDEDGVAPWMTYPSIAFIKDILSKQNNVFEYGSGYSTLFFRELANRTVSVEHDPNWYNLVKEKITDDDLCLVMQGSEIHPESNNIIDFYTNNFPEIKSNDPSHDLQHGMLNLEFAGYASTIYNYPAGYFDVIVLDGMARNLTGVMAVDRIAENGIIILDNSDRWQYNHLQKYLSDKGYKRIDFWGPGFGNHKSWCTSFYAKNMPFNNNNVERPVKQGGLFV